MGNRPMRAQVVRGGMDTFKHAAQTLRRMRHVRFDGRATHTMVVALVEEVLALPFDTSIVSAHAQQQMMLHKRLLRVEMKAVQGQRPFACLRSG